MQGLMRTIASWADGVFPTRTIKDALWKLSMEEIPELAQSYNKTGKISRDEIADVLILALDLCHLANIDPENAVKAKMRINRTRKWSKGHAGTMEHERGDT